MLEWVQLQQDRWSLVHRRCRLPQGVPSSCCGTGGDASAWPAFPHCHQKSLPSSVRPEQFQLLRLPAPLLWPRTAEHRPAFPERSQRGRPDKRRHLLALHRLPRCGCLKTGAADDLRDGPGGGACEGRHPLSRRHCLTRPRRCHRRHPRRPRRRAGIHRLAAQLPLVCGHDRLGADGACGGCLWIRHLDQQRLRTCRLRSRHLHLRHH